MTSAPRSSGNIRELDRLGEDLDLLDREIAESVLDDPAIKRLMTITGVNLTVAVGLVAAIGDIARFSSPQKLVSYFGLNPRVRQSGLGAAHHGRISKIGRSHARAMLVEAAWAAAKALGPLHAFFVRIRARRGHQVAAVAVRAQAGRALLAHAHQGRGLPLGPPSTCGPQAARHGAAGRPGRQTAQEGEPAPTGLRLNIKALRNREIDLTRQAEPELRALCRQLDAHAGHETGARAPQAGKA